MKSQQLLSVWWSNCSGSSLDCSLLQQAQKYSQDKARQKALQHFLHSTYSLPCVVHVWIEDNLPNKNTVVKMALDKIVKSFNYMYVQ